LQEGHLSEKHSLDITIPVRRFLRTKAFSITIKKREKRADFSAAEKGDSTNFGRET